MKGVVYMTTLVFRKPEFMRSDIAMREYLNVAEAILKEVDKTQNIDERYYFMTRAFDCIKKAAKAGGFLSVDDLFKWLKRGRPIF